MTQFSNELDASLDRAEIDPTGSAANFLDCAERLFADRGFDGVTTRAVAEAAGLNISTLHFHWTNKRTLYEAVCRRQARLLLGLIEEDMRNDLSAGERAERWVDKIIDLLLEYPAIARLAWQSVSGQTEPDLPSLFAHDVGVFHQFQSALNNDSTNSDETTMTLIAIFYFIVGAFSDSPLQVGILGGSIYTDENIQIQVRALTKTLIFGLITKGKS